MEYLAVVISSSSSSSSSLGAVTDCPVIEVLAPERYVVVHDCQFIATCNQSELMLSLKSDQFIAKKTKIIASCNQSAAETKKNLRR